MTVVAMIACLVVLLALAEPRPPRIRRRRPLFFLASRSIERPGTDWTKDTNR